MQLNSFLSSLLQLITEQDPRAIKLLLPIDPLRPCEHPRDRGIKHYHNRLHLINNGAGFCFWQIKCNRLHFV